MELGMLLSAVAGFSSLIAGIVGQRYRRTSRQRRTERLKFTLPELHLKVDSTHESARESEVVIDRGLATDWQDSREFVR